jgi:hypothetical protein
MISYLLIAKQAFRSVQDRDHKYVWNWPQGTRIQRSAIPISFMQTQKSYSETAPLCRLFANSIIGR